jgi:hypothetical protein
VDAGCEASQREAGRQGCPGHAPQAARRRSPPRPDFSGDPVRQRSPDLAHVLRVGGEQRPIAQQVDQPRHAARRAVDHGERRIREDAALAPRCDAQAMVDVVARLGCGQRPQVPADGDALAKLTQLVALELLAELGLAQQHDLQQLCRSRLQVGEQAHLLERFGRQGLRLVHQEQHVPTLCLLVQQELVEHFQQLGHRAAEGREPEFGVDGLQQFQRREVRVEEEGDLAIAAEALDQGAAQGGLTRADLADDGDEALALLDAVDEMPEGLAVRRREEEVPRVRGELEGLLVEAEILRVHLRRGSGTLGWKPP